MNPLKKGPEIKLPPIKAPDFLVDIYWDLRDRHLLPLAVILVLALVAVPFFLRDSSEPETPAVGGAGGATASTNGVTQSGALVAEAAPGLRDFRRRLDDLEAKDPFRQKYAGKPASSSSEEEGGSTAPAESTGGTTGSSTSSESESSTQVTHKLTYYSYAIDVRVSGGGSQESGDSGRSKTTVRRNLPELTMLPSRETPAIIYMGSTKDGKKALMLISSDVDAIFGDGKCVLGSQTCELLALEPGLPETFVYGGTGRTYKIQLLKIRLVESNTLNKAPLGKPKQKSGKGKSPAPRELVQPR
jgi:hypothetical protein